MQALFAGLLLLAPGFYMGLVAGSFLAMLIIILFQVVVMLLCGAYMATNPKPPIFLGILSFCPALYVAFCVNGIHGFIMIVVMFAYPILTDRL